VLVLSVSAVTHLAVLAFGMYRRSLQYAQMRDKGAPPGSLGIPIFGELGPFFFNPIAYRMDRLAKYAQSFTSHLLFRPTVIAVGVEDTFEALKGEIKGNTVVSWPTHFQQLMGVNAVTVVTGAQHKMLRKVLNKAFTPEACRAYLGSTDRVVLSALAHMRASPLTSYKEYKKIALEIFFRAAFGDGISRAEIDSIVVLFNVWLDGFIAMVPLRIPGFALYRAMRARDELLRILADLVERYRRDYPGETPTVFGRVVAAKDDDGSALSAAEMCDNLLTVCFAGHDTTFATLSTLTARLFDPANALVLAKLRDEVDGLFGRNHEAPLDYDTLRRAPYLQAVMDESWRVSNPVGFGFREALVDIPLPSGAGVVPAGWTLEYDITIASRNPAVWNQPEQFLPERFMPKMPEQLAKHYLVFGGGNRVCLGQYLAYLEVKVFLVRLLQGYDVDVLQTWEEPIPVFKLACTFKVRPRVVPQLF